MFGREEKEREREGGGGRTRDPSTDRKKSCVLIQLKLLCKHNRSEDRKQIANIFKLQQIFSGCFEVEAEHYCE